MQAQFKENDKSETKYIDFLMPASWDNCSVTLLTYVAPFNWKVFGDIYSIFVRDIDFILLTTVPGLYSLGLSAILL